MSITFWIGLFVLSTSCTKSARQSVKDNDDSTEQSGASSSQSVTDDDASTDTTTDNTTDNTTLTLIAPGNFASGVRSDSLTDSPLLDWDSVEGAAGYEVSIGTTQGSSNVRDWVKVGLTTSHTFNDLSLQNADVYYASVRAYNSADEKGPVSTGNGWQVLQCPIGWIKVPGDTTPGLGGPKYVNGSRTRHDLSTRELSDFCVMKYEAKDGGGHVAVSVPAGVPWRTIAKKDVGVNDDAEEACMNIVGSGLVSAPVDNHFYLINNNQWQTIARNIEADLRNKSGSEYNRGHTANAPSSYLAADASDTNYCAGLTTIGPDCSGTWHANKRTHSLNNDAVIWDFSGNLWEFVIDEIGSLGIEIEPVPDLTGIGSGVEFTASVCGGGTDPCFTSTNRLIFGPADIALTSANGIGRITSNSYGGAILRGSSRNGTLGMGGMLHTDLDYDSTAAGDTGFRCTWSP